MHKSVAEHIDLIPDEHEWIFIKQKSLYMQYAPGNGALITYIPFMTTAFLALFFN
ncbi:Uncharacterised protein [Shigella sonnei]|nr:Uncharacterised protein [Shigella sonnei]SJA34202.1 Uncharacterised protein [Shigella sonnei]SJF49995.1 Uncharacterised protein [Shigella sonnei]SJM23767.1 Uncharacterised protein [Shigella sonnei]